jgi:hypothetical protein
MSDPSEPKPVVVPVGVIMTVVLCSFVCTIALHLLAKAL